MKVLNNHKGDIDGRVKLDEDDLSIIITALKESIQNYPLSAGVWHKQPLLEKLSAVMESLIEQRVFREIALDHQPSDWYNTPMTNTDYKFMFPTPDESCKDVFYMEWTEAGRRYKIYSNEEAACWRVIRQRPKGTWEVIEEYDTLYNALYAISSYKGPCEEETKELYGVIRQTLASQSLEEIEINWPASDLTYGYCPVSLKSLGSSVDNIHMKNEDSQLIWLTAAIITLITLYIYFIPRINFLDL